MRGKLVSGDSKLRLASKAKFRWRRLHIALKMIALLLFIGQGLTGTRDLLEIPLSWQEPTVFGCDFINHVCGSPSTVNK